MVEEPELRAVDDRFVYAGERRRYVVFPLVGFGPNRDSVAGAPHFDDVTFVGRFPVAELAFRHEGFPGRVRMTAFSPFIPHNDRDSSMPAALFSFDIENDTEAAIDYPLGATIATYGWAGGTHTFTQQNGLSVLH